MTEANSIDITEMSDADTPQVMELFLSCLGDEGGAPTSHFWRWKHIDNPAGRSPVLLARLKERIVAVRAFMPFRFWDGSREVKIYRAVDTATDHDFRGRGLFRTLTVELLNRIASNTSDGFVFNTPNSQSKPGYMKMGWTDWGRPRINAVPSLGLVPLGVAARDLAAFDFDALKLLPRISAGVIKDNQYLKWRYQDVPMDRYFLHESIFRGDVLLTLFSVRKRWGIRECRICDIVQGDQVIDYPSRRLIRYLILRLPFGIVTFATGPAAFPGIPFSKMAPIVTHRNLPGTQCKPDFEDVAFSLGDLELF